MKSATIRQGRPLQGELRVPGDKSITHRAVILGALADGETVVDGYLPSEDCLRTVSAFEAMGISVRREGGTLRLQGRGMGGLSEPTEVMDLGNSGTSIRLLTGVLSAQPFFSVLTGDASLRSRPMGRVVTPLRRMGANIYGRADGDRAPLAICGGPLHGIEYDLPVASAQVKSALLLAALYAGGETVLREPIPSRDHTERLFDYLGIPIQRKGNRLHVGRVHGFSARGIRVPGDFSSAAFFIVAATLVAGSDLVLRGVGINATRTGLLDVLQAMGGKIDLQNRREEAGEPVADLRVRGATLKGMTVKGEMIPRLIDEFPILCVAAAFAEGETVIEGASELRVKESDRIAAMTEVLDRWGGKVRAFPDGIRILGGGVRGGTCRSHGDHRVAMAMAVAALAVERDGGGAASVVEDVDCIATSFPDFFDRLGEMVGKETVSFLPS